MKKFEITVTADENLLTADGIKFAIDNAFGPELFVDQVYETSFPGDYPLTIMEAALHVEVEAFHSELDGEERVQICSTLFESGDFQSFLQHHVANTVDEVYPELNEEEE